VKPAGKPDAGNPHVRFDERGWETGRRLASAPAPNLDSTAGGVVRAAKNTGDKIAGATVIMEVVPPLTFAQARETVVANVRAARMEPGTEEAGLEGAAGRVLAEDVVADRDVPAAARSVRDGYAVRASDLPGELEVIGEVRAGERFAGVVCPGQAVEIMTGAPVPAGADAVVMFEHTSRE